MNLTYQCSIRMEIYLSIIIVFPFITPSCHAKTSDNIWFLANRLVGYN